MASTSQPTPARRGPTSASATASRSRKSPSTRRNPDRLFVAVLGHPYGPNDERGLFRSTDGGESFQRVLYQDENTGGKDVVIDPIQSRDGLRLPVGSPPGSLGEQRVGRPRRRHLQVHRRRPHLEAHDRRRCRQLRAGRARHRAEQSAPPLRLCDRRRRRRAVDAAPARRPPDGAVYRSDDGGETWTSPTNASAHRRRRRLRPRVDPKNPDSYRHQHRHASNRSTAARPGCPSAARPAATTTSTHLDQPRTTRIMLFVADQGAVVARQRRRNLELLVQPVHRAMYHVNDRQRVPL